MRSSSVTFYNKRESLPPLAWALVRGIRQQAQLRADGDQAPSRAVVDLLREDIGLKLAESLQPLIAELVRSWLNGYSHLPLLYEVDENTLSLDERALLQLIHAWQQGDEVKACGIARWLVLAPWHASLLQAAALLAQPLRLRKHPSLLRKSSEKPYHRECIEPAAISDPKALSVIHHIAAAENLTLQAVRLWQKHKDEGAKGAKAQQAYLARFELGALSDDFAALMQQLTVATQKSLQISCNMCSQLSADEINLLLIIGFAQRGQSDFTTLLLKEWLAASQVDRLQQKLNALAHQLKQHGVLLPRRERHWQRWIQRALPQSPYQPRSCE